MTSKGAPPPDEIRRSPSGRVPQWVLDEAAGRKVERIPFRAAPGTSILDRPKSKTQRAAAWVKGLSVVGLVAALIVAANHFGLVPRPPGAAQQGSSPGPPLGYEEATSRILPAPPTASGPGATHYRFLDEQTGGKGPVAWSPCRPIHYVVRPANAPSHGDQMLTEAFARLTTATGLKFVDDGPTTEAPSNHRSPYQPDTYGNRWAPVLIAWATPDEVPDFGVDIAGEAGPYSVQAPTGAYVYVSGTVYLDPAKISQAATRISEGVARSVVLHELGHLVGLDHITDPHQIMWPRGNSTGLTDYQTGDRAGLGILGQGACHSDV